ncbi:hypothetical protein JS520_00360 [Candidatus Vidania fulgoroideae]|nr:hypothetical protein JS520_00360 [Candidatus Vidania fulgoroideae]
MVYLIKHNKHIAQLIKKLTTGNTILLTAKQLKLTIIKNALKTTTQKKIIHSVITPAIINKIKTYLNLIQINTNKPCNIILNNIEKLNNLACTQLVKICNKLTPQQRCFCIYTEAALKIINTIKNNTVSISIKSTPTTLAMNFKSNHNLYQLPTHTVTLKTLHQLAINAIKKKSNICREKKLITTILKKINDKQVFI